MKFVQSHFRFLFNFLFICFYCSCSREYAPNFFFDVSEISFEGISRGEDLEVNDLAINSRGQIFICDKKNSLVICFASDGSYLRQIGRRDKYSGDIIHPVALAMGEDDKLYIACSKEILIYNSKGKKMRQFDLDISGPNSIGVDKWGNIYVTGYHKNGLIHKYDSEGRKLKTFGNLFEHDNQIVKRNYSGGKLNIIKDRIYMTSYTPYNVNIYELNGRLVAQRQRPELDFQPSFEVVGDNHIFRRSSRGLTICSVDGLVFHTFYLNGKGIYLDIYDGDNALIHRDIPLNVHILTSDQTGYVYYMTRQGPGASVFRGRPKGDF